MSRSDHEVRPTGGRGNYDPRTDERRPWWRKLDLIAPDGSTFLRRRGLTTDGVGGVLLHRIDAPDPGLDLHDHPWSFASIVLRGGYTEEWGRVTNAVPHDIRGRGFRSWGAGSIHRMPLNRAHRITAVKPGTVTLVLHGPRRRRWGFFMPTGWVDWAGYDYEARRPVAVDSTRLGESMDRREAGA